MDFGVQIVNPCSPGHLSGYFDAFIQDTQAPQQPDTWSTTLMGLYNQRAYLEGLLSKTATTLNALRDKQTRNDRVLLSHPGPRSKKKKMMQNRWRTDKTIQTCENEESVILDCLQVCRNNINTLESMMYSATTGSTAAENDWSVCPSYIDSESTATDFDWNGWGDESLASPFQRPCHHPLVFDEVPPDSCLDVVVANDLGTTRKKPPPLPPRARAPLQFITSPPPPPPNTAHAQMHHSALSPVAVCFEPKAALSKRPALQQNTKPASLDKSSISGLLASKRVQRMQTEQKRRFSDAQLSHVFNSLSGKTTARPSIVESRHNVSWGPEGSGHKAEVEEASRRASLRRMQSF
ncbi:hypothetical protein K491DRAFT_689471 [Lophiostoma macrostomum CBS 122681]|uniref:Uncharacterized protein n=1 Tax=Lophiostoma macrostomum CBS 122681 TaxID=1314788 RepID=A0A6A6TIQ6_9PLEO|nr:hypothetical protein K491DRAFT_689471 [Lophiostoma macrostomum CBS 122681]